SACAYSLWAVLLQHNPVSKVTVFGFLNPVCGVMISSIVLHERGLFNWQGITALMLVCAGIITVNLEKSEKNYKL
ncbi:MAG: DMT family transporter, partial [Oscillospiraceae bacterium]|nr:DMT family transporter [Oscillospiraceae bacterium]